MSIPASYRKESPQNSRTPEGMPARTLSLASKPPRRGRPPNPENASIDPRRIAAAVAAAGTAKCRLGTWQHVAQYYGACSKTAYYRLVEDPSFRPSLKLIEAIEARPLPPPQRLAEPCPSCGAIHGEALDCCGQAVVAVVILHPGETVSHPRAPADRPRRRTVSLQPDLWQQLNQARQAAGQTWPDFLAKLLEQSHA